MYKKNNSNNKKSIKKIANQIKVKKKCNYSSYVIQQQNFNMDITYSSNL